MYVFQRSIRALGVSFLFATLAACGDMGPLESLEVVVDGEVTHDLRNPEGGTTALTLDVHPRASFHLNFNAPKDLRSLERAISLEDSEGARIAVSLRQRLNGVIVTPEEPLKVGENHTLVIEKDIEGVDEDQKGPDSWTEYFIVFYVDCAGDDCTTAPPATNRDPSTVIDATNGDRPDDDGDGISNDMEVELGTDPTLADTDGDGLTDAEEVQASCDPLLLDGDADGVSDKTEGEMGTSCSNPDSDNDTLSDGEELAAGTDPLVADTDLDGMDDAAELVRGTDPLIADTDGDGDLDGAEVDCGSSPIDAFLTCATQAQFCPAP